VHIDFRGQGPQSSATSSRLPFTDLLAVFLLGSCLLIALVLWMDNAEGVTGNGAFKAMTIKQWMAEPSRAPLNNSNYLYFPLMAILCGLLDLVGVFVGDPRRQLTIINAVSAAACLCLLFVLVYRLTHSRLVSWATVLFQVAAAFFLRLAISNEDILPSYAVMFAAMVMACLWFSRPTWKNVALVAITFTLAWLMEWRLMFPVLPPMLLALLIAPGRAAERLGRIAVFLGTMLVTAKIAMILWGAHENNVPALADLLWTGKGTETGYAGFAWSKVWLLWVGTSQYLLGGINISEVSNIKHMRSELLTASAVIAAVALVSLAIIWRQRSSPALQLVTVVFGGTFAAGAIFNLYSQPQDPQMQINVMSWLAVGWALMLANSPKPRTVAVAGSIAAMGLLSYNVWRSQPGRGTDTAWIGALNQLERSTDPARTVYLVHGFEPLMSKAFYYWNGKWNSLADLGTAPTSTPKFKFLTLVNGPVDRPNASPQEWMEDIERQVDRVQDLGYDVVATDAWAGSTDRFVSAMATISGPEKSAAFYQLLQSHFSRMQAFHNPMTGTLYRLEVRPGD
jgi:hypothetical protein